MFYRKFYLWLNHWENFWLFYIKIWLGSKADLGLPPFLSDVLRFKFLAPSRTWTYLGLDVDPCGSGLNPSFWQPDYKGNMKADRLATLGFKRRRCSLLPLILNLSYSLEVLYVFVHIFSYLNKPSTHFIILLSWKICGNFEKRISVTTIFPKF